MVGLFTPGKNQKEIFRVAEKMKDYKIKFHFVGNLALNFKHYWGELLSDDRDEWPENVVIWDEQHNVDQFYSAFDLFYFSSKLECNPIVLKEALGWNMPILMYNLDSYCGSYDNINGVKFLNDNENDTIELIKNILNLNNDELIVSSNWMDL
tara:strand:- start:267 stop:722 length:456 start_codon:yes stop_codon:yes gene_type:complete